MLSDTQPRPANAQIEEWLAAVKSDPRRFLDLAGAALADEPARSAERRCDLHRVCAAAGALELDTPQLALAHGRQALHEARRTGHEHRAGLTRMLLARALVNTGSLSPGLRQLDRAAPLLRGTTLGSLHVQRMVVLYK